MSTRLLTGRSVWSRGWEQSWHTRLGGLAADQVFFVCFLLAASGLILLHPAFLRGSTCSEPILYGRWSASACVWLIAVWPKKNLLFLIITISSQSHTVQMLAPTAGHGQMPDGNFQTLFPVALSAGNRELGNNCQKKKKETESKG